MRYTHTHTMSGSWCWCEWLDVYLPISLCRCQELHSWLEAMWLYALVWGIGGSLDREGRRKFDSWLRSALNGELVSQGIPRTRKVAIPFPHTGSVFDFKFDNQVRSH